VSGPVLELADVSKDYRGLRPLRIARFTLAAGEQAAILGLDQVAAEVLVNLVTGAFVPDRGDVKLFGRSTTEIADSADWLAVVDRFGIVTPRAVMLDPLSVVQNLSMPFTLDIEPPPDDVLQRATALAREVNLAEGTWTRPAGELGPTARVRLRFGRALALDPAILLLEHPTAEVPRSDVQALGREVRAIAERRGAAILIATADEEFATHAAARVLTLDAATGTLAERRRGWWRRA
jgi:ABC-type lipoprotein export system ATPase subunit